MKYYVVGEDKSFEEAYTSAEVDQLLNSAGTVTGVKGNSESLYRTGNVNITKTHIGLGNVDNTADANKSVRSATSATQDANGNVITTYYQKKISVGTAAPTSDLGVNGDIYIQYSAS